MAFPQTPLPTKVTLDIAGVRTDITGDVYHRDQMKITRGRRDWGTQLEQSKLTAQINNRSGAYSFRNPNSPHWGVLRRNTEIQVSLPSSDGVHLLLPGGTGGRIGAPDAPALGITSDIDVRIELTLESWRAPYDLIGKWDEGTGQRSWTLQLNRNGQLAFVWTVDGAFGTWHQVVSTAAITAVPGDRLALRATLDVNNGAGGNTVAFYTAPSIGGTWVPLGTSVIGSGTTSIFDGTAPLKIGDAQNGQGVPLETGDQTALFESPVVPITARVHKAELRSGIAGSIVANPDMTIQTAGDNAFADTAAAPNTWTITAPARLDDRDYRFTGEVTSLPQRWDVSGEDVWVPIEAAGVLARLTKGASALQSTMRRAMVKLATELPVAYWPCEDTDGSTVLASGLPGQQPMTISGVPSLASSDIFPCSESLPTVGTSQWRGRVPGYTATGGESHLRFLLAVPSGGLTNGAVIARLTTSGTASRFDLTYTTASSGTLTVGAYNSDGTLLASAAATGFNGLTMLMGIGLTPGGPLGDFSLGWRVVGTNSSFENFQSLGPSMGTIRQVFISPNGNVGDATMGHIAVMDGPLTLFGSDELDGFTGERAAARFQRLCAEEGILARLLGPVRLTPTMGPQRPIKLIELFAECVDADGAMFETRDILGLGFRPAAGLTNQTPRLSLSYDTDGEVAPDLEPDDDDQSAGNDVTASNVRGSSARVELETGPLSVQPPPDGVGRYEQPLPLNLESDLDLPQHASWRVHLNTVDEARYPQVRVDLAAAPHLDPELRGVDTGDLLEITDLPSHLPPDPVLLLVMGYTEKIGQYDWDVWFNCSSGSAWSVGVRDDPTRGRRDTAGSELAAAATDTATSLQVATTLGPAWTWASTDLPFYAWLEGEQVAVNGVSGPDWSMESGVSSWSATSATFVQSSAQKHSGAFSGLLTVTGTPVQAFVRPTSANQAYVTPGCSYTAAVWVYSAAGYGSVNAAIDWYTALGAYISTSATTVAVPAATWTRISITGTAPGTAANALYGPTLAANPPAATALFVDDVEFSPIERQVFTVTRSINGVIKPQSIGAKVRLWQPAVRALS